MAEKHQNGGDISHWTLDKRIPIALIATVVGSTLTGVVAAAITHHRVGTLERQVDRLEANGREAVNRDRDVAVRLADLTSATNSLREAVQEFRQTFRDLSQRQQTTQPPGRLPGSY